MRPRGQEYHGHTIEHLEGLVSRLRQTGTKSFVYLAGDSTLDNKHWLFKGVEKSIQNQPSSGTAINGYEHVLDPPLMMRDVNYWLNYELAKEPEPRITCVNGAVEESCISQRETQGLLDQDKFIRDNITEDDILVVDVGGNDVALRPTCGIIFNMAWLLYLTPTCLIRCCPWLAPGMWYFFYMFRVRLRRIIDKLIAKRKPKMIVLPDGWQIFVSCFLANARTGGTPG